MSKTLVLISIIIFAACKSSRVSNQKLNLNDSLQVANFIKNENICAKIHYVEKNKEKFVDRKRLPDLILFDIAHHTKYKLLMPYVSGRAILTTEQKVPLLQDQLDSMKVRVMCK